MPAGGEQRTQHIADPANQQFQITPYTAQQIATIQSRLDKQLGPEYVSSRPGANGLKVHYLPADKVINLANEVFGFNGWCSSVQRVEQDFCDQDQQNGRISLGLSVIVRVTLKDGTFHEDIGYGHIENAKSKAAAFEKAKKEGTTDAMKRALRTFGNVLGNCLYDKSYLTKVTKLKVGAGKWNPKHLHRHPDFAPEEDQPTKTEFKSEASAVAAQETTTTEDEGFELTDFDEAEFDEDEFGLDNDSVLPTTKGDVQLLKQSLGPTEAAIPNQTTPSRAAPSTRQMMNSTAANRAPLPNWSSNHSLNNTVAPISMAPAQGTPKRQPALPQQQPDHPPACEQFLPPVLPSHHSPPQPQDQAAIANQATRGGDFYSARAAANIDASNNVATTGTATAPRFDPHAESPSIPRTSGVDHTKSMRLYRNLNPAPPAHERNGIGHTYEQGNKPGVPGPAVQSPTGRGLTTQYRPPTRRGADGNIHPLSMTAYPGGVDRVLQAARRTPLGDVSNVQPQHHPTAKTPDGADAKRQRVDGAGDIKDENAGIGVG